MTTRADRYELLVRIGRLYDTIEKMEARAKEQGLPTSKIGLSALSKKADERRDSLEEATQKIADTMTSGEVGQADSFSMQGEYVI